MRDQVFISYCQQDRACLQRLQVHLAPLVRRGLLHLWDDTRIQPGERGQDQIAAALRRAKVAVLLVSADYFAADDIAKGELAVLLKAAESRELRLLWVPVRASLHQLSELAPYKAAHTPEQPLAQLPEAEQEAALVQVCRQILDVQSGDLAGAAQPPWRRRVLLAAVAALLLVLGGAIAYRSTHRTLVVAHQPAASSPPPASDLVVAPTSSKAAQPGQVEQEIEGHVKVKGAHAAVQRVTGGAGVEVKQVIKGDVVLEGDGSSSQDVRIK